MYAVAAPFAFADRKLAGPGRQTRRGWDVTGNGLRAAGVDEFGAVPCGASEEELARTRPLLRT